MVKQVIDKSTGEIGAGQAKMFSQEELSLLRNGLEVLDATIQRAIRVEQDPVIRDLRNARRKAVADLVLKLV